MSSAAHFIVTLQHITAVAAIVSSQFCVMSLFPFFRHSTDCRLFLGIFRPVEARCKEIQSMAGYAGGQIGGLSAAKGWSASRGLHPGTPCPRPPPSLIHEGC